MFCWQLHLAMDDQECLQKFSFWCCCWICCVVVHECILYWSFLGNAGHVMVSVCNT